jgi:hypothetical protein
VQDTLRTRRFAYTIGFTLVVMAVVSLAVWETYGFHESLPGRSDAGAFPRLAGYFTLALCAGSLLQDARAAVRGTAPGKIMDLSFETELDPAVVPRRIARAFAWAGGFVISVILVGFHLALLAFVPLYLRVEARVKWYVSAAVLAACWIVLVVVFAGMLNTPLPRGRWIVWP